MAETMRAVVCDGFGGVEVLRIAERPLPVPGPGELLVRVRATALNRADTLQRQGGYAPPPGESDVLGVEIAGDLLMAVPVPAGWSFAEAAAVPEVFYTADTTLFELGGLAAGQTLLLHAAASGVGTACIQLAREVGATTIATAGSAEKLERCLALGAEVGIDYKRQDFVAEALKATGGRGVDVVEDFIGTDYLERNLAALKDGGSLILVGVLGSHEAARLDLLPVILRRLQIKGSSMRPRPLADKRAITKKFRERWLPLLEEKRLQPVIDSIYPFADVAEAHRRMDGNLNFGKILLALE